MVHKIVHHLTDRIVGWGYADIKLRDIYRYNLENRISAAIAFVIIMITGILFHKFMYAIIFLIGFTTLNGATGGYHAPTLLKCLLLSDATFAITLFVSISLSSIENIVVTLSIQIVGIAFAIIVVFIKAPYNHPNLDLDTTEIQYLKKKSRKIIISISLISVLMILSKFPIGITSMIILTMDAIGISLLIANIKIGGQHNYEKETGK